MRKTIKIKTSNMIKKLNNESHRIPKDLQLGVVYRINSSNCEAFYIGKNDQTCQKTTQRTWNLTIYS
jgi:hypothetical protein